MSTKLSLPEHAATAIDLSQLDEERARLRRSGVARQFACFLCGVALTLLFVFKYAAPWISHHQSSMTLEDDIANDHVPIGFVTHQVQYPEYCHGGPAIPLDIPMTFNLDSSITSLGIFHEMNDAFTMDQGLVEFDIDESATNTRVVFMVDVSSKDILPDFRISESINEELGAANYTLHTSSRPDHPGCYSFNMYVILPNADALASLKMQFVQTDIKFVYSHKFRNELDVATKHGNILAYRSLASPRMSLSTHSGIISGNVNVTQGYLFARAVSGHIQLHALELEDANISVTTDSGNPLLVIPDTFECQFRLRTTLAGHLIIDQTYKAFHENFRYTRRKEMRGQVGNNPNTSNAVMLNTESGRAHLDITENVSWLRPYQLFY
ncbi:hypothetical protein BC940DRAFT_287061 [Gongronella butleri]|nr:hypothetical protein BC940DRAFT_287061 [Gongronella butleri]